MTLPLLFAVDEGPVRIVHINARVELHSEGDARVLFVHGLPVLNWSAQDPQSEAYGLVLLVRAGFATATEVSKGLGISRMTVYRVLDRFKEAGLAGLIRGDSGPKGPSSLRDVETRRMLARKGQGASNVAIAASLGVTEGAVRHALRRVGYRQAAEVELPLVVSGEQEPAAAAPAASEAAPAALEPDASAASVVGKDESLPVSEPANLVVASVVAEAVTATDKPASAAPVTSGQADVVSGADPWDRSVDRVLAPLGLISEAPPQFGDCQEVADLGVLLAMPALVDSGVFDVATKVYSGFGAAFYGVRTVFLCLALMALQRVRRPEQLRHHNPVALGRALGLDRAPEVKTLRKKVKLLSDQKHSEVFMRELAKRRVESRSDAMGFLYVDGHVRVYNGKVRLGKMHVTRMRLSMPATADHWVNDRDGDPLLVLTATPTTSLAKEMLAIAREARELLGDRRVTVIFDRGGWSPKLFAQLIKMNFDVITYRKGRIPKIRAANFTLHEGTFDARKVEYQLAERSLVLKHPGGNLKMREVVRLSDDGKHQTSIVTSRTDLAAVEVAYRMFERWRQENFFKYMESEFAIDALWTYGTEEDDGARDVPNPERKSKEYALKDARAEVARLERIMGAAAADNDEAKRPSMRGFKIANGSIGQRLRAAREHADQLKGNLKDVPKRVSARDAAKGAPVVRLKTEAKRLTDTMKSVAYQAETALFRMVRPHYSRHEDEGRKLIASAFHLTGDINVLPGELRITLSPAASPNRTRAIAKLCEELTATNTVFPGTQLRLSYAMREA